MKSDNLPLAVVVAAILGVAQMFLLLYCWVCIAIYSPLPHWLASLGVKGIPLQGILFVCDSIINIALCLPAAFALCQLRPRRLVTYLIIAVVPSFIWQYSLFFQNPAAFRDFVQFIPGIVSTLFVLPVATVVALRILRRVNT